VKNGERLRQNWNREDANGVAREGNALLQGIVYCGICGCKMGVQNRALSEKRSPSYICQANYQNGEVDKICQSMTSRPVDAAKKLARHDGLLIDEMGYVQQSREEMEVLFTLLAERYERGSVLLTSNLPFSKWEEIFKDPMTTVAAIDRLVHHSVIVELNIPSYRMEAAKKNRDPAADTSETNFVNRRLIKSSYVSPIELV
jgi:hypothetical protein